VNDVEGLDDALRLDADAALLVDSLTPAEARRFATLLDEARTAETAAVHGAVDAMMSAIPPPVRGRVRRIVQGRDR
jgi:hypothetical protein